MRILSIAGDENPPPPWFLVAHFSEQIQIKKIDFGGELNFFYSKMWQNWLIIYNAKNNSVGN